MGVLLAALSAVCYGSADFMGGLASRHERALMITWYSQMVGLVTITLVALIVPAELVTGTDWVWGGLGGLAGAVGLLLLYGALAVGPMAVVAPVTALCSAIVPVIAGVVIDGERPSSIAVVGIVLALPAIGLVASSPAGDERVRVAVRVVVESVVSGVMFGLFFVFFARAGEDAGMWPTVAARVASVSALCVVVLVATTRARRGPNSSPQGIGVSLAALPLIAGAGVFDVAANGLYLVASRNGLLSQISVVSAMYPAATVALARVVLRERMSRLQIAGLVLAAAAVALVAYGKSVG